MLVLFLVRADLARGCGEWHHPTPGSHTQMMGVHHETEWRCPHPSRLSIPEYPGPYGSGHAWVWRVLLYATIPEQEHASCYLASLP